ncbi:MAG: hypothetical protein N3E52_06170 [Candidatus Bathyarchaeota archaeon]|nr:hypothetical protein [Candidatus Bathyarchaeota archaeon]
MRDIYNYDKRIQRCKRSIEKSGENGKIALRFLDHLASQGLSQARISKLASHMPPLLRLIDLRI